MNLQIADDPAAVARDAATLIAGAARDAVKSRGRFTLAVSGGHTPWIMLRELAGLDVPWSEVHLFQVDERIAPEGDPDRNLTHLRETLLERGLVPPSQVHSMPVNTTDLQAAAQQYASELERIAGRPPVLDLVHLGLGPDGHTASLIPGDPVLGIEDRAVAITGIYQGRQRMTLTYPVLNAARRIVWVVTGSEKAGMLRRLLDGDRTIPAGRVRRDDAMILADRAAAAAMASGG